MEATQVGAPHPLPVVDGGERRRGGVDREGDSRRRRVEAVGDDLGKNRLIEVAGVGIGEILEEMK